MPLQAIALDETAKPSESILALRTLLEFRFGRPAVSVDLDVQHDVGPSVIELLEQIGRSESHRQRLEQRERRMLAAVEIEQEVSS